MWRDSRLSLPNDDLVDRSLTSVGEAVKYRLVHHAPISQVLYDDPLEQLGCDAGVPDPLRVHDHDRSPCAHAEAWGLTTFYPGGAKQEVLSVEQLGEKAIQRRSAAVRRTEAASADEHVTSIRVHSRIAEARVLAHDQIS